VREEQQIDEMLPFQISRGENRRAENDLVFLNEKYIIAYA
jgi:hypothetical protein